MECLIHHEGHEEAGEKNVFHVVFCMAFMPFMVTSPSVNQAKPRNFCRWPEEENGSRSESASETPKPKSGKDAQVKP
jgi:hypothetical protein